MTRNPKTKTPNNVETTADGKISPHAVRLAGATEDVFRKDIVSGKLYAKSDMIRFCLSPDGVIVPDLENRLPGKGIWVAADNVSVRTAMEKRLFQKAARRKKAVCPENMPEKIQALLVKRCQNLLGVARKAGQVVSGFEKVMEALHKKSVFCLLEATDAGTDAEKVRRAASGLTVYRFFTAEETGRSLGRDRCAYAALKSGGAANALVAEIRRATSYATSYTKPEEASSDCLLRG